MDIKLPRLAEGVESGIVVNILVNEGQQIKKDQPIMELETQKAVGSIPSPATGTVTKYTSGGWKRRWTGVISMPRGRRAADQWIKAVPWRRQKPPTSTPNGARKQAAGHDKSNPRLPLRAKAARHRRGPRSKDRRELGMI